MGVHKYDNLLPDVTAKGRAERRRTWQGFLAQLIALNPAQLSRDNQVDLALLKRYPDWSPLLRGLLALAPLIPGLFYIRNGMRFIRGLDELQRRIQHEAWLFAALGTVIMGTGINILNAHGVQLWALDHGLGLGGTFTLMFTLWLVGSALANCRYK